MSPTNRLPPRGKKFDFSVLRARKQECIIAGVLGIVIVGSAWLVIRQFLGTDGKSGPSEFHYNCEKCGNEFTMGVNQLPPVHTMGDERNVLKVDCPKCKTQKSAWRESECPKCHKYFVADSTKARYIALGPGGRGGVDNRVKDVCPLCKTDVNEWYRAHPPD
jgi:hypothetical protein